MSFFWGYQYCKCSVICSELPQGKENAFSVLRFSKTPGFEMEQAQEDFDMVTMVAILSYSLKGAFEL